MPGGKSRAAEDRTRNAEEQEFVHFCIRLLKIAPLLGPAYERGPTERDFAALAMTATRDDTGYFRSIILTPSSLPAV